MILRAERPQDHSLFLVFRGACQVALQQLYSFQEAAAALRELAEAHAQQDPTFHSSIAYARLTAQEAIAKLGITATGTAVLTQAVVTAVSYSLDLYRGDITVEEFRDLIVAAAVSTGIAAPVFFLIFIAVLALFPELALLLSAPAVVAGFNALFGMGIAIPIIQSLMRHIEAGGFGDEVAVGYQNLMATAEPLLEPKSSAT